MRKGKLITNESSYLSRCCLMEHELCFPSVPSCVLITLSLPLSVLVCVKTHRVIAYLVFWLAAARMKYDSSVFPLPNSRSAEWGSCERAL